MPGCKGGRITICWILFVVLALCAVMSGVEAWDDIEDWGREREAWMGKGCPAVKGRVIATDGKALRGSARVERGLRALHQVSAYAADYR